MTSFGVLNSLDEDALHSSRLLNIEEKVFRRVSKRLLTPDALLYTRRNKESQDQADDDTSEKPSAEDLTAKREQWKKEALLDFSAFEANVVRVQFLLDSNIRERQRYADEKIKIQETAQAVKDSNARLAIRLTQAQQTRDLRKTYDALADEITSRRTLKPRDEQRHNLEKLTAEIAELQREKEEYRQTWAERREQFGKIVDEGKALLALIKNEKEDAERLEEELAESDNEAKRSGATTPMPATNGDRNADSKAETSTKEDGSLMNVAADDGKGEEEVAAEKMDTS